MNDMSLLASLQLDNQMQKAFTHQELQIAATLAGKSRCVKRMIIEHYFDEPAEAPSLQIFTPEVRGALLMSACHTDEAVWKSRLTWAFHRMRLIADINRGEKFAQSLQLLRAAGAKNQAAFFLFLVGTYLPVLNM